MFAFYLSNHIFKKHFFKLLRIGINLFIVKKKKEKEMHSVKMRPAVEQAIFN